MTEHIKAFVDTGLYVCGIFIDLAKAFDTVNHKILCEKLNYYGLCGNVNKLIQSNMYCGVPQGSSLGPLFLIYK